MSEDSFAEHNIQKLAQMANEFGYSVYDYRPTKDKQFSLEELIARNSDDIILLRASDMYGSGSYNELLAELLQNYRKILDVLLPTLGEERAQTYSPFMPISPITGKVLEIGVTNYHPEDNSITFMENNQKHTLKVEYDNFKLQWKVDFALQWLCFKISYEMSGKDITEGTVPVAKGVLEALEREPPITPVYEMFLAADGSRMSKTKGNGISLDDLVKYTSPEVIRHFMFLNPTSAKRLDMQKMPAYIDAFIKDLELFNSGQIVEENPIWYSENVAPADPHFNASTILNVIQGIHPPDANSVISFVNKRFSLNELDVKIINSMYHFYHDHHIKPHYVDLPEHLVKYMVEFLDFLSDNPLEMQTKLYELGNQAVAAHDVPDLKSWFEAIYRSLIGTKQGPRLGSFFALYGVEESVKLIRNACKIMA
jgi:lysyl-tRNA synthetase class 1